MLIKRQFRFAFAAVVSALLLSLAALLTTHFKLERIEELRAWANRVVKSTVDCNALGTEAILQDNSRAREQYRIAASQLAAILVEAPDNEAIEPFLKQIRAGKKRLDALLRDFESKTPGATVQRDDFELQSMLVSQWMLQTRDVLETAQRMRRSAADESTRLRRSALLVNIAAFAVVALITGGIFWRSYSTLVTPLQQLSEGARRVGAGDLQYKMPVLPENEIGQAAESFNQMTAQLAERESELNEKMRDLEAFSYSVAHDLKSPLRSIVGFSGLLDTEFKEQLNDEGRGYVERIRAGSLRMATLIDDLLQFGRLTQRHIDVMPVSLGDICSELLAEMKQEIIGAGATVHAENLDWTVQGNVFLLKQALANLIGNAMKFVRPGHPAVVHLRARKEQDAVVLEIQDNGIGIPPEFHSQIFGLFHRLHDHKEYPGTGIGLAIVQKSIERLGGKIGLQSQPGQGTTFWIRLRPAQS